jgi:hypothetical protein
MRNLRQSFAACGEDPTPSLIFSPSGWAWRSRGPDQRDANCPSRIDVSVDSGAATGPSCSMVRSTRIHDDHRASVLLA